MLNARMYSQVHNSWKHGKPDKINQEQKPPKNVNTATHTPATMTNLQWSYVFLLQAISTGTKGKFRTSREKCGEKEDEFHVVEKAEFHVAAELQKSLAWDIMICYKITSIIKHHGSSFICLDRNEKHDQQGNKQIQVLHTTINLTYSEKNTSSLKILTLINSFYEYHKSSYQLPTIQPYIHLTKSIASH